MASVTFPKLGPGSIKFGSGSTAKDFAAKCTDVEIAPTIKTEEAVDLLSGDNYQPDADLTGGTLTGSMYQEFDLQSLIAWSWTNAGKIMPFEFVPATAAKVKITGTVRIHPIKLGGAVKKANKSEFSFDLVGDMPKMSSIG